MPKSIDVSAVEISGDFTETVPSAGISVRGNLFGETFDGIPPKRSDVFTFPNGPIVVRHGKVEPIHMTAVSFTLRNPTFDPPGLDGTSLRFGGDLIFAESGALFGESFDTITTFAHVQVGVQNKHVVRFVNGNQEIRIDFILEVTSSF